MYAWDSMDPDIVIDDRDLIAVTTEGVYSLLTQRSMTDVIFMGVHTNLCVFKKPGALASMYKAGLRCFLASDLNDAFTRYEPDSGYTPDSGTMEIDLNLARANVTNVNLSAVFGKRHLLDADLVMDFVRFAPWGTPVRPYMFETGVLVTLTLPHWIADAAIRYTTDGR
jgi:hypothetical protein